MPGAGVTAVLICALMNAHAAPACAEVARGDGVAEVLEDNAAVLLPKLTNPTGDPGKGFVELTRRYVVAGTTELRRETLFLGFRLQDGRWALAELRSAP